MWPSVIDQAEEIVTGFGLDQNASASCLVQGSQLRSALSENQFSAHEPERPRTLGRHDSPTVAEFEYPSVTRERVRQVCGRRDDDARHAALVAQQ